ncbi:hypothetical protein [Endozoicomonas acroporae]|uniref:hypothetical protein n=1 Tax=Endozoicomonas acroporae TaxID=1701104 RepID=UPI003D7BFE87
MTYTTHSLETTKSELAIPLTVDLTDQNCDDKPVKPKSPESSGQPIQHRVVFPINHPEPREPENLSLLMEPLPGKTTAFHQMQPHKADEPIIDSPEFKPPPGKINKLALAIKIFSQSFKTMSDFNTPETDRSARVETIRRRVSTVTAKVLDVLTGAIILKVYVDFLSHRGCGKSDSILLDIAAYIVGTIVILGVFGIGWLVSQGISILVTATVAASVDTREKLTEMTAFTSPNERFLKKYDRMKESLRALRTKLIDAELAIELKDCHASSSTKYWVKEQARLATATLNPGAHEETWFESIQRNHLRECYELYEHRIDELRDVIRKTEDWLTRNAKQKELLTNVPTELQEVNGAVISGNGQVRANPVVLVRV